VVVYTRLPFHITLFMFGSRKKKKTSFEPPDDVDLIHEQEEYIPHQHQSHREPMSRSNPQQILNSLAASPNSFAAGIALCVKALAEATAGPPSAPIVVDYRNRRMAFGRKHLARLGGYDAIRMAARKIYPQGNIPDTQRFNVDARLFDEDGQLTRRDVVAVDLESWEELLPYIHTLFIANEAAVNPRDRDRDRDRERERERERERQPQRERDRDRPRRGSFSVPNPGLERREDPREQRIRHEAYPESSGAVERGGSQNEGYPPAE